MNDFKNTISTLVDKYQHDFEDMSSYFFDNPELGGEEFLSSSHIINMLEKHNFVVNEPYETLPTAIVASFINNPSYENYAFIAEYDALPGYGEDNSKNAHACGHNWIAATMTGCAIVLSKISKELGINVSLIGTPAEETFGAKYDMINLGAFDNVDYAFQAHLDAHDNMYVHNLAMNSIEFTFKGLASHASQAPDKGINALDAVISMFVNIGLLRQQLPQSSKVHGIISNGGSAPNIIPDLAACQFSIREKNKSSLKVLKDKIVNIANAAALSTGCTLEYTLIENPFDDSVHVDSMIKATEDNFKVYGMDNFLGKDNTLPAGSSDIGNVSYICPTIYAEIALDSPEPMMLHTQKALKLVNSKYAYNKMNTVIKAFCSTAVDISQNKELACEIKSEFKEKVDKLLQI